MKTKHWIKCVLASLLAISLLFSMTACAFNSDISKKMIIQGIGVDKADDGYLVSVHYLRPGNVVKIDLMQSQGKTVSDALQNLTLQTGLIPTYSHNAMVIFGKECAQDGLTDVFDFFLRYHETRPTVDLFIAENRAETIFELKDDDRYTLETQTKSFAEAEGVSNRFADATVLDVISQMAGEYNAFALPELTSANNYVQLGDTAYFRDNKLIGYLDRDQTRGYLAAAHALRSGVMVLKIPNSDIGAISLRIENTRNKIKTAIIDGVPHFQIDVTCKAYITEINQDLRKKLSIDAYQIIEDALNQQLKEQIQSAINQAAIKDQTDIFNLGTLLQQQQTQYWKEHCNNWAELLPTIKYTVNVNSAVDRVQQEATPAF